jgi:hypothetical protein
MSLSLPLAISSRLVLLAEVKVITNVEEKRYEQQLHKMSIFSLLLFSSGKHWHDDDVGSYQTIVSPAPLLTICALKIFLCQIAIVVQLNIHQLMFMIQSISHKT